MLGAVIDFSVLNLLIFGAGWSSPLQMAGANVVSTTAAILSNFFLNRSWTFRGAQGERRWLQFTQFIAVSAVGLVINATVFALANHYIFGPLLHTGLSVQLAKAAAIGVGMFWNFIANRLWTFRHRQRPSQGNTAMNGSEPLAANPLAPDAGAAQQAQTRRDLIMRWLLPLAAGLLLLGGINLGLYKRLAPASAAAAPAAASATDSGTAGSVTAGSETAGSVTPASEAADSVTASAAAANAADTVGGLRLAAVFADGSAPAAWLPVSGDWQVIDGALVQTQREGYDLANFHADPFANYLLRVRFKLLAGTGAGVLFNAPGTDSKNGAHLVRFTDDGAGLFWGHFSAEGVFTGQGYAATGAPGNDWHVLEVFSAGATYAIHLDGAPVAQDIPLRSASGHIGLTTSQSTAAFANVEVFDLAGSDAPLAAQELSGNGLAFSTINGDWVQDGARIRQENSTATDFSLGTGVSAENYTFEVAMILPDDPALADAGGGILFHMPTRNSKEGAQMVRFVNGGAGLSWGYFNADGSFTGQGYVELNLPPGEPQHVALAVRGAVFDVLINGAAVVQDVPTTAQGGWIGLLSFRGPVTFEDARLTLGSVVP